jgi:hypothetical protein
MLFSRFRGVAPSDVKTPWRLPARETRLRLARAGLAGLIGLCAWLSPFAAKAGQLDFPPVADFNVLSPNGLNVIGHTHFALTDEAPGFQLVYIESHYLNGEYDIERNEIETRGRNELPVMATYEHGFFRPGGVMTRQVKADFRSGRVSCTTDDAGVDEVDRATLDFPSDTYAGSALLIPLQHHLIKGSDGPVAFYDFACIPGPKIFKVQASATDLTHWPHYPGLTQQVDIKPDFGWLDLVVAPFVPKMHAWFNPRDDWNFVGGIMTRYYRGPEIILARVPPSASAPRSAAAKPNAAVPQVASAPPLPTAKNSPLAVH